MQTANPILTVPIAAVKLFLTIIPAISRDGLVVGLQKLEANLTFDIPVLEVALRANAPIGALRVELTGFSSSILFFVNLETVQQMLSEFMEVLEQNPEVLLEPVTALEGLLEAATDALNEVFGGRNNGQ